MPANVGEMFYTGAVPWHGLGVALAQPANIDEALRVGGLGLASRCRPAPYGR